MLNRRPSRTLPITLAGLTLCAPVATRADVPNRAAADALFEQGKRLLASGETDTACAALAESQRLAPRPGTLLNLALCHEAQGRTATAAGEFRRAESFAREAGAANPSLANQRERLASAHAAALEPILDHL